MYCHANQILMLLVCYCENTTEVSIIMLTARRFNRSSVTKGALLSSILSHIIILKASIKRTRSLAPVTLSGLAGVF